MFSLAVKNVKQKSLKDIKEKKKPRELVGGVSWSI